MTDDDSPAVDRQAAADPASWAQLFERAPPNVSETTVREVLVAVRRGETP